VIASAGRHADRRGERQTATTEGLLAYVYADGASSPTVCRVRLRSPNLSYRLFLLTDKTTSPFLAYFHVLREEAANSVSVSVGVFCDEGAPYDGTRELFVRCMGAEMGMRVREEIDERRRCSCAER